MAVGRQPSLRFEQASWAGLSRPFVFMGVIHFLIVIIIFMPY